MTARHFGRIAPSTGIATGLMAPLALGAPGNLDPGFADHGRATLNGEGSGQAWSIEALDDDALFVAGGELHASCAYWYYYCDYYGVGFADDVSGDGTVESFFTPASLVGIEVRDALRQPDGKVLMVGRRYNSGALQDDALAVYRLDAGGTLDTTFGAEGIFTLPEGDYGERHLATSAVLDPDGRLVVSGSSDERLIVLRLLPDGMLDTAFGAGGVFVGPLHDYHSRTFIERTAGGGYRVSTTGESQCRVVGLTDTGALDGSFGVAGIAGAIAGEMTACGSMAAQADGNLLVSGTADGQAFATRLLATGAPDPAFAADAVAAAMTVSTAIAVGEDGRILVAGRGEPGTPGAAITRLAPDGSVDASFGEAGTAIIDLLVDNQSEPWVNALDVRADGTVLAAGGDRWTRLPFVARLSGDDGADSPGIIGFAGAAVVTPEGAEQVVSVRRTGGKSGSVSVAYSTAPDPAMVATAGDDYAEVTGTLTWDDGDASEREIIVPVLADSRVEEYEGFRIALGTPDGGAGLGKRNETITILPDGAPAGQFAIGFWSEGEAESSPVQVTVFRNFYFDGEVSVTLTPLGNSATAGEDFDATPITLTWADQDREAKTATIAIIDDDERERSETFTLTLTNPTGGAVVGPYGSGEFTIGFNDGGRANGGGGGSTGWTTLLLLGLASLFRYAQPRSRKIPIRIGIGTPISHNRM